MRAARAYQRVDTHTSVLAAKQLDLVVLAYDALIARLLEVVEAIRTGDIARRGEKISRALDIVDQGLIGSLDMNQGGAIAKSLQTHYQRWSVALVRCNLTADVSIINTVLDDVKTLRSAWDELRKLPRDAAV